MAQKLLYRSPMAETTQGADRSEQLPVRLRGGPGDGQLFHIAEPPEMLTYGVSAACYVRVPTDGAALEYRFTVEE